MMLADADADAAAAAGDEGGGKRGTDAAYVLP